MCYSIIRRFQIRRLCVYRVLFVCTGNICRSPTAEGVFRDLVKVQGLSKRVTADSAGIGAWHIGDPPDPRSIHEAMNRGVDISDQRARKLLLDDFEEFDLLLAMDYSHHDAMYRLCPPTLQSRIRMFMDYAPEAGVRNVPDPYYGSGNGFSRVYDMIETASTGLLDTIQTNHLIE